MHFTIYDTPIVIHILRGISGLFLKISGWKIDSSGLPESGNYFVIAAPHTSNWDFFVGISIAIQLRIRAYWIGKHTLFKGPMGVIGPWLGGIALDRSKQNNMVGACIQHYAKEDNIAFALAPEGTRSKVTRWKMGFYHIALGANVPVALAYFDYKEKTAGLGKLLHLSGDMDKDMATIENFYATIAAKYPDKYNVKIFDKD